MSRYDLTDFEWRVIEPRTIVLADKAYDADRIRELIQEQGAASSIPKTRIAKRPFWISQNSTIKRPSIWRMPPRKITVPLLARLANVLRHNLGS
jgi:transposase